MDGWASPSSTARAVRFTDSPSSSVHRRSSLSARSATMSSAASTAGNATANLNDSTRSRSRSRSRSRERKLQPQHRPDRLMFTSGAWQRSFKRRRLRSSAKINLFLQSILLFVFCFRVTLDYQSVFWSIFRLQSVVLFTVLVVVPEAVLVAFLKSSSVDGRAQLIFPRIVDHFSRSSTYSMLATLVVCAQIQFWGILHLALSESPLYFAASNSPRYIIGVCLFTAAYFVDVLLHDRLVLHFPSIHRPINVQLKNRVAGSLFHSIQLVATFECFHFTLLPQSISLPILPALGADTTFSYIAEISFIFVLLFICMSWTLSKHVMEVVLTQSILAEEDAGLPLRFLVDVLDQDHSMYIKYIAAMELQDLAERSSVGRHFIYSSEDGQTWTRVHNFCTGALDALSALLYDEIESPRTVSRWNMLDCSKRRTQQLFARLPFYMWCSQALSFLAIHSIEEDEIGVVQRSLEQLLSSMLSCSLAIEEYVQSPAFAGRQQSGGQVVRLEPLALSTCLDNSIYRIVGTFYTHLKQFSFPRDEARRLRQFAAYER